MFFSSNDDFDGRLFPRARAIERQLRRVAQNSRSRGAADSRLPAV